MPGRVTSKVYFARPLTLSGPSRRLTRVPTTVFGVDGQLYFGSTGGCCGAPPRPCGVLATLHLLAQELLDKRVGPVAALQRRALSAARAQARHRLEHAREGSAAADVAVEALLDLFRRRVRVLLEQTDAGHDEARRAEAAHQRVLVAERLLHRVQLAAGGEAVHGANLLALALDRERRARVDRAAVDDHRAGAAGAAVAAAFVARHVDAHAQRVEQRHARLDRQAAHLAVDVEGDRHGAGTDDRRALGLDARGLGEHARRDAAGSDCLEETPPAEARLVFASWHEQ